MDTAKYWKDIGNNYVKEQKFQEALNCYSKAIELDPTDPILYSNRSLMHSNLNEFGLAIEDAEKAIKLKPDYSKAHLRLGKAYEGKKDYQKAFQIYSFQLEKDKDNKQLNEALAAVSKQINSDLNEPNEQQYYEPDEQQQFYEAKNEMKNNTKNLIEKYALNKRVELVFVRQISDYRIKGVIKEINGGFIYFIQEDKLNNTQESHIININNIIDIHILE